MRSACQQGEAAVGDVHLVLPALHNAHKRAGLQAAEVGELHAVEHGAGVDVHLVQLHAALRERVDLDGGRGAQDARDLRGAGQLRVERHAQPEVVLNEVQPARIFRVTHAGDRVAHTEALGDEAREQILLVRGHHGDDKIGRGHAGLHLRVHADAVALDGHDVERVADGVERSRARVDDGDLVTLAEQLLRQRRADLAGSDDNNVHSRKDSCMVNFKMIQLI